MRVKVSRRTQKVDIHLANVGFGIAFFSTDLGHHFASNAGTEYGVMLRGKEPHKPEFAYDIVPIHYPMIYTDMIECYFFGNKKAPLLRCFPFFSKPNAGDFITTGQYMKNQTLSNLKVRRLLKNSSHSFHFHLSDMNGEKNHCVCRYHSSCFDV